MSITEIQDKIQTGEYRISDHATKRMLQRSIDRFEVMEAILNGEIVEEYPQDKYSPIGLGGDENEVRLLRR